MVNAKKKKKTVVKKLTARMTQSDDQALHMQRICCVPFDARSTAGTFLFLDVKDNNAV